MFRRNSSSAKLSDDNYPVVQVFGIADAADADESRGSLWKTIGVLLVISLVWIGVVAMIVWLFQPDAAPAAVSPALLSACWMASRFTP